MKLEEKLVLELKKRAEDGDESVLRSPELKSLFDEIKTLPSEKRKNLGVSLNGLRAELVKILDQNKTAESCPQPIDVTAPWDVNSSDPELLPANLGSVHPVTRELDNIIDIYARMGFSALESRQIDDEWHMFTSLNFPEGHPARDDFDTFTTTDGFVAPAHTSTMQNRVLSANKRMLDEGQPIAYVIPGRVFRNEDLDARHDHTFHQLEGIYVDRGVHAGMLIATLKTFLQEYYQQKIEVKTQPSYFPFTEPSFEFALSCPFCQKKGCNVCSKSGWIELLGCGMIHPNVLRMADIDPGVFTGFAWGGGIDRMVMMKYGIEDIRHFHSGRLSFLRQFP